MKFKTYGCCWWFHVGKYVLRVGNPWNAAGYRYAWRPLLKVFRCYR